MKWIWILLLFFIFINLVWIIASRIYTKIVKNAMSSGRLTELINKSSGFSKGSFRFGIYSDALSMVQNKALVPELLNILLDGDIISDPQRDPSDISWFLTTKYHLDEKEKIEYRSSAAKALGNIREQRALKPLCEVLLELKYFETRSTNYTDLENNYSWNVSESYSINLSVNKAACRALKKIGKITALPYLERAITLKDEHNLLLKRTEETPPVIDNSLKKIIDALPKDEKSSNFEQSSDSLTNKEYKELAILAEKTIAYLRSQ